MVSATYDIFDRQDIPDFILCNPSGEQLYSLKAASKKNVVRRFNSTSELNLELPKEVNGVELPAYNYLKQTRLVLVDDDESGYFIIVDSQEDSDGAIPKKVIKALSIDFTLVKRRLTAFGGTYALYDPISPTDSLLGSILQYIPSWTIGTVDASLLTRYRTFDVSDTNIYEFLVSEVEEAYECIIIFDTINKTISAKTLDNATTETDVFISHHNLIKTSSFREVSDEMSTALNVTGGGNLSINAVNPLGTNIIYNYDYYKDGDGWMSAGLISALDTWEALIAVQQPLYALTLTYLKTANTELIVLEGELDDLESDLSALEGVRLAQIEADPEADLSAINEQIDVKQRQINLKETEITNKSFEVVSQREALQAINSIVSFDNNFTTAQLEELDYFTVENSYQNENIAQLDSDTPVIIQEQAQILYDQGVEVLERVSQPKYEFTMDAADMLALKEFESVSNQLVLGSVVYAQNASGQDLELVLLEIEYDYTNPNEFMLVFSNRLRLSNGTFLYSDIFGKAVKTGNKVSYDKYKWGDWEKYYKNDVSSFIKSNLDASLNALVNGENQELLINENGLRLRKYDATAEDYDPAQMWMNSKSIMFTQDNWQTASLGIGQITHDGSAVYGVIGGAIVGTILAGNELRIANDANNFTLDETGASLVDASFTLSTTNGKTRMTLDADVGIKIEGKSGGNWSDRFYANSSGDVIFSGTLFGADGDFSGTITANEGKIGRIDINSKGLYADSTHFMQKYANGESELKWGGLHLKRNGDAIFSGDIYANKLIGEVNYNQLTNIPVNKLLHGGSNGTLSGSGVSGGTITWDGVQVYTSSYGQHWIQCQSSLTLSSPSVAVTGTFRATGATTLSSQVFLGQGIDINGDISVYGVDGLDRYIYYRDTSSFAKYLRFSKGILIEAN